MRYQWISVDLVIAEYFVCFSFFIFCDAVSVDLDGNRNKKFIILFVTFMMVVNGEMQITWNCVSFYQFLTSVFLFSFFSFLFSSFMFYFSFLLMLLLLIVWATNFAGFSKSMDAEQNYSFFFEKRKINWNASASLSFFELTMKLNQKNENRKGAKKYMKQNSKLKHKRTEIYFLL